MEAEIQPAGWTAPQHDVTSPLLFINLFLSSAEPSEPEVPPQSKPLRQPRRSPPPPTPQHTPFFIHSPSQSRPLALLLPPANEGGQMLVGFKKKWEEDRGRDGKSGEKEKVQMSVSLFFPPSSVSIASCVSSCLACKSFSCTAGRPLLALLQPSTLLSPCQREKEERTNIVTAKLYCNVARADVHWKHSVKLAHRKKKYISPKWVKMACRVCKSCSTSVMFACL